jgi:hypothetical protein
LPFENCLSAFLSARNAEHRSAVIGVCIAAHDNEDFENN